MEYRSGPSFWRASAEVHVSYPALHGAAKCNVAVVGGGISGVLVAYHLVQAGLDTILVDQGSLACESTAASTGLLQYEIDTPLFDLIKKVGEEHAVRAYRRGLEAIDELEELTKVVDNRCGFSRRSSLYFATTEWHLRQLKREFECRREHGFDVRFLEREELRETTSLDSSGAIQSTGDGQLNPFAFTHALLRAALHRGLSAYENTKVTGLGHGAEGTTLQTPDGPILAQHVVFATGYASEKYLEQKSASLHSTYVATSEPLSSFAGWPAGCLLWETARPYFYARQTDDGRAMIGGEDTSFRDDHQRDGLVDRKTERLVARFEKLFPQIKFRTAYTWAGTFAETADGLAYIGQPPNRDREYFALGYGGNGITFSMIAARLITDLILGRANADAAVFRFGR